MPVLAKSLIVPPTILLPVIDKVLVSTASPGTVFSLKGKLALAELKISTMLSLIAATTSEEFTRCEINSTTFWFTQRNRQRKKRPDCCFDFY